MVCFFRRFKAFIFMALVVIFIGSTQAGAQQSIPINLADFPAIVMDGRTGKVLFQNRADEIRAPASITKLMALYLTFDALESGRINWNTRLPVSANAAKQPRMKLGVPAGSTITVREAVNAMIVVSANDATVIMAEYLAGSDEAFARMMTMKARSLGLRNTTYKNSNGLTEAGHVSTARDIARLSIAMRDQFPQYYKLFSMRSFNYQGKIIKGHNRVLERINGADGLKTGYTRVAGFTITTTVNRGGRHLVVVVLGGKSANQRDDIVVALVNRYLDKASRFSTKKVFSKWSVAQSVWRGQSVPALVSSGPHPVAAVPDSVPLAYAGTKAAIAANDVLKHGFVAQVAALPDDLSANNFMKQVLADLGRNTLAQKAYVEKGSLEGTTVYRVRFGQFDNDRDANAACAYIKKKTYDCFVTEIR